MLQIQIEKAATESKETWLPIELTPGRESSTILVTSMCNKIPQNKEQEGGGAVAVG